MVNYTITELDISSKGLTQLPDDIDKYTNLQILCCNDNEISSLDNLPPNLQILYCNQNQFTSLDNLPLNLQELYCMSNQLTSLDNLPPNLQILYCWNNPLKYDCEPTIENIKNYNATRKQSS